jgi:hypothetical protein
VTIANVGVDYSNCLTKPVPETKPKSVPKPTSDPQVTIANVGVDYSKFRIRQASANCLFKASASAFIYTSLNRR